jgi:hypothetical protein
MARPNITSVLNIFFFYLCGGTLGTAATNALWCHTRMISDGDCGEIGGMKIGRGNRSTRRKPAPAPLCPPQIPHAFLNILLRRLINWYPVLNSYFLVSIKRCIYRVFRAQADWTFILPSELPAKELRHLLRKLPPLGAT